MLTFADGGLAVRVLVRQTGECEIRFDGRILVGNLDLTALVSYLDHDPDGSRSDSFATFLGLSGKDFVSRAKSVLLSMRDVGIPISVWGNWAQHICSE